MILSSMSKLGRLKASAGSQLKDLRDPLTRSCRCRPRPGIYFGRGFVPIHTFNTSSLISIEVISNSALSSAFFIRSTSSFRPPSRMPYLGTPELINARSSSGPICTPSAATKASFNWKYRFAASGSVERCHNMICNGGPASIEVMDCNCDGDSSLHEILSFILAVSRRAAAASLFNSAILDAANSRAKSQWCSLTIPIQTIAIVAAAPIIKLTTRTQLARSNIQVAQSNDGQGSFAWFAISAISTIIMEIAGLIAVAFAP